MTHRSSETDTAPCHQLVFERVCVIPGAGTSHRSFAVRLIAMCTFVFFHLTLQTSPMLIPVAPTHLCSQLHLHKGSRGHNSPVVAAPLAQEPGNRLEASQFPAVPSPTRLQPCLPARQSPRMWLRPFPDKSEAHGETDGSIRWSFRNAEIHFVFVHGGISSPPQQRRRTLS